VPLEIPKSMTFRACLYPSPDVEDYYVAHCLELDVIGEGCTPEKAILELMQAIELQIENCNELPEFFFPAPASIWKRYKDSLSAGRIVLKRIVKEACEELPRRSYTPTFENITATRTIPSEYLSLA
jgi:predicted RNase H-like HicB family nuclease